ncbi:MAG: beta-lactamase family protein [Hyphomonadaceae bacterium]|nr:beta-lactamase family protein [Hyphomonadaceae bacterium]
MSRTYEILHLYLHIPALIFVAIAAHSMAIAAPSVPASAISPDRLADLEDHMKSYVSGDRVGNLSYGVWQRGELIESGFYGPTQAPGSRCVDEDTLYQIYSMTKPVTAVGLLILHERGYFNLDDPITTVLPEFEGIEVVADYDDTGNLYTYLPPGPPTFRHLLSHTAGFAYQSADRGPIDRRYLELKIAQAQTGDALVERIASVPLMRQPGAEWHYSFASDLQGVVIERLTGDSLHVFLKREIFDRLNMRDTGFFVPDDKANRVSVTSRTSSDGLIYEAPEDLSEHTQSRIYFEGGHGLISTLADYHRFLECLRRGGRTGAVQILTQDSIDLLTHNAIRYRGTPAPQRMQGKQAGLGYGFGVSVIIDPVLAEMPAPKGTYYWYGALGSWFWVDPVNEIVVVGMVQTRSPVAPEIISGSMTKLYSGGASLERMAVSP